MTPEMLTIGRVSVDLYPEQVGVSLAPDLQLNDADVAARLGCADEMPSLAEVEELLCAA
jgi:hypothetical protein